MLRLRRQRTRYRNPPLTAPQTLAWADDFKRRIGRWPHHFSGRIPWTEETWMRIDGALRTGYRKTDSRLGRQLLQTARAFYRLARRHLVLDRQGASARAPGIEESAFAGSISQ